MSDASPQHTNTAPVSSSTAAMSRDFAAVAVELGWLDPTAAEELMRDAAARGAAPGALAASRGALTPAQVDVVETLLRPREAIAGYEILSFLGQGGMGVVYRARQSNLGRVVALKSVLVSQLGSAGAAARFEQEAMTVARLSHPHIVAAYDFGRHEGRLYFAMELVAGEDVEQYVARRGRLDEATAWGLVRQAAAGLAHAAQHGVVHRDIKPANLLLVEPPAGYPLPPGLPMVKIADFGLAFLAEEVETRTRLTAANTTLGSPHYMSPEQLGSDRIDHRADIYALGATAYHMLAGAPPFDGARLPQILAQKCSSGPAPLASAAPTVSAAGAALVGRMMAIDPEQRPPDYADLIAQIDALATTASSSAPSPSRTGAPSGASPAAAGASSATGATGEPSSAPRRRRVGPIQAAAVLSILLIIAAAIPAGIRFVKQRSAPVPRELVLSGWSAPLFDGQTQTGWRIVRGIWSTTKDDEGGGVLSGRDGVIARSLPAGESGQPPTIYRLTMLVDRKDATAAEVEFGLKGSDPRAARLVARITPEVVQVGHRLQEGGAFQLVSERPRRKTESGLNELRIERQEGLWWIQADGESVTSIRGGAALPEFRLRVEGGPAWFSDIQIDELAGK